MKRRLTSAALCLFMLATAASFAACGQEDDLSGVGEEQIDSAMTLNIYGIKGEGTTDEAIAMVEEAMSSITEAQFNTAIKLMLYTEDEYDEVLEAKMDAIQEQLDLEAAEAELRKKLKRQPKRMMRPMKTSRQMSRTRRLSTRLYLTNTVWSRPSIPRLKTPSSIFS